MTDQAPTSTLSMLTVAQSERLRKRRRFIEYVARGSIMLGGLGVIAAVAMIFFYLLYEVAPMFAPADSERGAAWMQPADVPAGAPLFLSVEEQNEIGFRVDADGGLTFFAVDSGATLLRETLPHAARPLVVSPGDATARVLAVGHEDGRVQLLRAAYETSFDADGKRSLQPVIEYPWGSDAIPLLANKPARHVAVAGDDTLRLVARSDDGELVAVEIDVRENMMTGETALTETGRWQTQLPGDVENVWLGGDGRFLFVTFRDGRVLARDLRNSEHDPGEFRLPGGAPLTASTMLLGNNSLLVGDGGGHIHQLFLVRDDNNDYFLRHVRRLAFGDAPIVRLQSEQLRKSFVAVNARGEIGLLNAPAQKLSLTLATGTATIDGIAMSPRGDGLLVLAGGGATQFLVHNEHPDVSISALWSKVWYEGYDEEKFIWQSSAATSDFEPKYSLVPLVYGTLKAAFFAMLMAIPLAICGAIYTAYFMAPGLRRAVKPTIELMEALPTVILGFLAGLWLAPMVEGSLPGIFAMLVLTPFVFVASAWGWYRLPERIRLRVPNGIEPLLLVPVVILAVAVPLSASDWMEVTFFGGDMRLWLRNEMGIPFDQRNALIIGFAMGFAVIPTIYSIAEDALFEVPKHLTQGSLALGATPWQTVVRVVLPTASPGIFSAVMMGFGRAVGETMIVLMATGNTPVMTMNIFEGLRTLSANIAVEMPESEVGSSHFRILFLAALVLFLFTFVVNTSAELVRQRLRKKYGTL